MDRVAEAVKNGKQVKLIAYSVSPRIEARLKDVLRLYLEHHRCDVLHDTLYTAIKELLINATKANYKNIFFENYNTRNRAENVIDYQTSLKLFRLEMSREGAQYLTRLSRLKDLKAEVLFRMEGESLVVKVANPAGMTEIEMGNVNRKLEFARGCHDITEYFDSQEDDPHQEGAGLGLILIAMIARSLGMGERGFRVMSGNGQTVASLEVPLTETTLTNFRTSTGRREA
ncbi:MAG: hypothetical protein KBA61_02265 [Spirochaetes bacterium]|nr:hypothetical protein [Spirochaetota bacterium]HPA72307.1 hypothetical protein [Spirochaetota bacterium]